MAGHVPAFTQHTQLFHRRQKDETQSVASRNSMHWLRKNQPTPLLQQDILGRNVEKLSAHAVEKHGGAKIIIANVVPNF
ncbi:MAG: hypothetical protein DMG34_12280 [Acidobacteria bacterium]|nr:MAG: hypothetical protein DMG34_12280 [Acidobacteriota bacterium]